MDAEELLDDQFYEEDEENLENEESYDSSSSYLGQSNNGNKFFNKQNRGNIVKENSVSFKNKNSNQLGNNLNKKVRSQAKENPKQVNLSKPSSKNPKDFLKNSVNKAKNAINSIHNNKKNSNEHNKNQQNGKQKNPIEQVGDEAAKKALSAVLQYYRVPKAIADKLVDKYGDKALDFVKKTTIIATVIALAPIVLLLLLLFSTALDDDAEEANDSASDYISGNIGDEEFYNYLVENGMVEEDACFDENDIFISECNVIKYFSKLKENVENSEQMLTIYYAMAYDRELVDLYSLYDSDELKALINNKRNLKDYINGEYLSEYRNDLVKDFDLYSQIEEYVFSDVKEEIVSDEFTVDMTTGFKMRIARAQRTNPLFYENNPSNLEGECVWYVLGRANEILDNWNKKYNWTYGPNGGDFCYTKDEDAPYFQNHVIDNIEQGSIISWMFDTFGHVAIVEKVNRDSSGSVESIEITEGGLGFYNWGPYLVGNSDSFVLYNGQMIPVFYNEKKKYLGDNGPRQFVNEENYKDDSNRTLNKARRMALCESHGTGCQGKKTLNVNQIGNYIDKNVTKFCTIPLSQFN